LAVLLLTVAVNVIFKVSVSAFGTGDRGFESPPGLSGIYTPQWSCL
jgi:hypothetical protein